MNLSRPVAAVFDLALVTFYLVYLWTLLLLAVAEVTRRGKPRFLLFTFHVTKWPALAEIVLDPFFQTLLVGHLNWHWIGLDAVSMAVWLWARDLGDDDWWSRRKKKAKGKLTRIGWKLVLVPEPEPV